MAKRRETATSVTTPGDESTPSAVPTVRRDDPAPAVADLSGVSGLSGMQPSHPRRKSKKVQPSSGGLATGTVGKDLGSLGLEEKINLLNGLKDLLKQSPKIKSDLSTQAIIDSLYKEWVSHLMDRILNVPSASVSGSFTKEEVTALKTLAVTILQRQKTGAPAPVANPQTAPGTPHHQIGPGNPNPQNAAPMIQRQTPLEPGVNTDAYRRAQAQFLSELTKLEREGPQF